MNKNIFLNILFALTLQAGNVNLEFKPLDLNDENSKKLIDLVKSKKIQAVKVNEPSFFKINDNIYLYDNCNAPRFSGINVINITNGTNEQFAYSKCSLARSEIVMFDIDKFSETFTLVTSYNEETYFRVTENKCDFDGKCASKYLLEYRMNENKKPTLCKKKENDIFSCASGKKVISICEEEHEKKEQNILTYRFGKPNSKPELEYSSKAGKMEDSFDYAFDSYMNGSTRELSFEVGKYNYTIHQDTHNYKENSAGLILEKDNNKIAYFECNKPTPKNSWDIKFKLEEHKPRHVGTKAP